MTCLLGDRPAPHRDIQENAVSEALFAINLNQAIIYVEEKHK